MYTSFDSISLSNLVSTESGAVQLEHLPSCQHLADRKLFIGFSVLCRSILDLIIQLKWIENLDTEQKEKAIKLFLEFEGIGLNHKGRLVYEWQYLIDPDFSYREIAIKVGLDKEIINLNVSNILLHQYPSNKSTSTIDLNEHKNINLTIFDYLSKISHWNPRILNDLIGVNKEKHLGFTGEYLRLCAIALITFICSMSLFVEIFVDHFFPNKLHDELKKLELFRADFERLVYAFFENQASQSNES